MKLFVAISLINVAAANAKTDGWVPDGWTVGHQSCLPPSSSTCYGTTTDSVVTVGDHACVNNKMINGQGGNVCHRLPSGTVIDDHSCIGYGACYSIRNQVKIGKHSCVGDQVKEESECDTFFVPGHKTCQVCNQLYAASVGSHSCEGGSKACLYAGEYYAGEEKTSIGDSSCRGFDSCAYLEASVGSNSCKGYKACCGRTQDVGDHECNGDCACCEEETCRYEGGCDCKKKMLRG